MADCGGLPQADQVGRDILVSNNVKIYTPYWLELNVILFSFSLQPAKVIEAIKYFIQGLGYCKSL